jgi:hypothetical protein
VHSGTLQLAACCPLVGFDEDWTMLSVAVSMGNCMDRKEKENMGADVGLCVCSSDPDDLR